MFLQHCFGRSNYQNFGQLSRSKRQSVGLGFGLEVQGAGEIEVKNVECTTTDKEVCTEIDETVCELVEDEACFECMEAKCSPKKEKLCST